MKSIIVSINELMGDGEKWGEEEKMRRIWREARGLMRGGSGEITSR